MYRSGAKHLTIEQYVLLVFAIFEVLEGPIHGGDELGKVELVQYCY
jgi:hypothetical protein